jgi:hypothetical protein
MYLFLLYWGLNSGLTLWATLPSLFWVAFFQDRVSRTICSGWLQIVILLISAFWVARITGISLELLFLMVLAVLGRLRVLTFYFLWCWGWNPMPHAYHWTTQMLEVLSFMVWVGRDEVRVWWRCHDGLLAYTGGAPLPILKFEAVYIPGFRLERLVWLW